MRRALTALLCITVLLAGAVGCARRDPATPPAAPANTWPEGREFWSTAITEDGAPKAMVEGTRLKVEFGKPGELMLHAGCNQLGLTANIEGDRIKPYDYYATMMGCPGGRAAQDIWMQNFFFAGPSWSVTGNELVLRTESPELRLTDKEVLAPVRTLTGQRWVVNTIISKATASSTLPGSAYLEFAGDGTFTGKTACATLQGKSTVDGDTITVSAVERTEQPCEGFNLDIAAEHDRAMMATLNGTLTFTIDAGTLTLRGPDGNGLVLTAAS